MLIGALLAVATVLGGALDLANSAVGVSEYVQDHPFGQLAPGSNAWKAACADAFKSFDPDNGWYVGLDGKHHPCRIKIVRKW